jgi:hypothetical protein
MPKSEDLTVKSSKSLRRKPARRQQSQRFLVVVEGVVTEVEYLNALKRSRQMRSIDVQIETGHTDPIGIVTAAKTHRRDAMRTDPYDQVWCVFDAEAKVSQACRTGLAHAVQIAIEGRIDVALSNPCLEIWLLWHLEDQTAWISSETAQRRCRELQILSEGKHLRNAAELVRLAEAAKHRAVAMDNQHECARKRKPEDRNPSSGMYKLVESIHFAFPPRN